MFHVRDGLYFERVQDGPDRMHDSGAVRIIKRADARPESPIIFEAVVDDGTWQSIISTVSYYGEGDYGYYRAGYFHQGTPLTRTDKWSMADHILAREQALLCPSEV